MKTKAVKSAYIYWEKAIMKIQKQEQIEIITEKLSWIKNYIELNNIINLNDINIASEDFFCALLNLVYEYNLINLNKKTSNYPGIDLGDTNQKVSVQVTSERTRKKVQDTLDTFNKKNYIHDFNRLIFFVIGEKIRFRKPFDSGHLTFDPSKDIIDINQLVRDINKLEEHKIKEVCDYLNKNLIISNPLTETIAGDFISKQYKLVYALCLTKLKAIGIDESTAHTIISNGVKSNPYPNIENVEYLVGGFGCGKSHSLYLLFIYQYTLFQQKNSSIIPIFIEAKSLINCESIESWASSKNFSLENCLIILDGLDEMEYEKIELIMQELDFLCNLHQNFSAIVGSREMSILAGKKTINIAPLSIPEINTLFCQINNLKSCNIEHLFNNTNNQQMLQMLSKPFFAIIYALYMKNTNQGINNEMDLVSLFINKSFQPYIKKNSNIYDIFAQLAVLCIDRNLGYINHTEFDNNIDCDKLLTSGFFITDARGNYTFSLPIVAQWLGAYAIRKNLINIDDIISDKSKVIKWRYTLSILFSQMTYDESAIYFSKLVLSMPGIASIIIRDGIKFESAINLPSADICAKRIYDCMSTWLSGLKNIDFDLKTDGKHVNTLACSVIKNRLIYSWADNYLGTDTTMIDYDQHNVHFHAVTQTIVPAQATWPWIITFEHLSNNLEEFIKKRHWILSNSSLEKEFVWKNALKLLHKGNLYCSPIALNDLEKYRKYMKDIPATYNQINLNIFFSHIDSYTQQGHTELSPPYVPGDKDYSTGWIWSNYSKKQMLIRIRNVYTYAINEYQAFIDTFFPSLKEYLSTYLIFPCRFVGILEYEENGNDYTSCPSMVWYLSPLPKDQQSICNITYDNSDNIWENSSLIFEELKRETRLHRLNDKHYITFTMHNANCFDSSETPITNIIYSWLEADLQHIGWIK